MNDKAVSGSDDIVASVECKVPMARIEAVALHQHEMLLKKANEAVNRNEYSLAIILAQVACELCVERAFILLFSFNKIDYLYHSVTNAVFNYTNLKNEKAKDIYKALSKDDIGQASFWQSYKDHIKRRHKAAHQGTTFTKSEAEESCRVAKEFIDHIDKTLQNNQPADWGL